ncbi:hypothetical protein K439DRAFT_1611780 [Ramaria rubella]|nr:hypothetical protein K439DRAFT_1611780 [Ramaria rubella]
MSFEFLPEDERRSPSPAISNFSTPTKASNIHGAIISSHVYSPPVPVAEVDEISMLRLETFKPCRDHIKGAQMMLSWTHEGEQLWMWPSHPDGRLFANYELPTAFEQYYIALPQCPCALQETDPAKKHDYHIWVMWDGIFCVCLSDLLMKYLEMPSQMYKERPLHDLGPGLPRFNNSGILHFKKNTNSTPSKIQTGPSTMSNALPITPPPPYSNKGRGHGLATARRSPSKGPTSMLKRSVHSHAASMDDPFTVVPGPGSS